MFCPYIIHLCGLSGSKKTAVCYAKLHDRFLTDTVVSTARYKFSLQIWFSLISFFDGLLRLKQFLEVSPTTELLRAELFDASSTGTKHKYCRIILLIQKAGVMKLQNMISLITEVHHPD